MGELSGGVESKPSLDVRLRMEYGDGSRWALDLTPSGGGVLAALDRQGESE
jgi:hypothetical protein